MNLKEFLDHSFYKEEVQDVCLALDLPTTGDKDELVKRILRFLKQEDAEKEIRNGKSVILDAVRKLNKDMLQLACDDADIDSSGTKDQLLRRVIRNLEWPAAITKAVPETQDQSKMNQQTTLDESYISEPAQPEGFEKEGTTKAKAEMPFDLKNFLIRYFDKDTLRTLVERTGYKVSGGKETIAERIVEIFQKLPDDEVGTFLNRAYWYLGDWRKACKAAGVSDSGSKMDAVFRLLREIPEVSSRIKPEHRDEIGLKIGEKPSESTDEAENDTPREGLLGWIDRVRSEPESAKLKKKETPRAGPSVPYAPDQYASNTVVSIDEARLALYKRIAADIYSWVPRKRYSGEEPYHVDLASFLTNRGYTTQLEEGAELVDILVDDQVPIEMKKSPTSSEYDRMQGQLFRFEGAYGCAIGVVCDAKGGESYADFVARIIRTKGNRHISIIPK